MKIDILTILGLIIGVAAILVGQQLEGGKLSTLINGPAALIVIGGTVGAVMLQSPIAVFIRAIKMLWWTISTPQFDTEEVIQKIIQWSNIARREGLLGLENLEDQDDVQKVYTNADIPEEIVNQMS
jgi:chemotaxis protein MotA